MRLAKLLNILTYLGWATVMYSRVGKLKTRVGKRNFFSALRAEFCPPWPEILPAPLGTIWPICAESAVNPQPTNHATWLGQVSRLLHKTTLTTDYGKSAAAVAEKNTTPFGRWHHICKCVSEVVKVRGAGTGGRVISTPAPI